MKYRSLLFLVLIVSPYFIMAYGNTGSVQSSPLVSTRFLNMNSSDIYLYHHSGYDYFVFNVTVEIWNRMSTSVTFYFSNTCTYSPLISANLENKSINTYSGTSCGDAFTKVSFLSGVHREKKFAILSFENWTHEYLPSGTYNITSRGPVYTNNYGSPVNNDFHSYQTIVTVVNGMYTFSYDQIPKTWGKITPDPIYRSLLIFLIFIGSLIIVLLIRKLYYRIKNYQN